MKNTVSKPNKLAMRNKAVTVNDKTQKRYRYALTAAVGRGFDPEFTPELTPSEMLRLGVFCGKYMIDCRKEFPASWFKHGDLFCRLRQRQALLRRAYDSRKI